MTPQAITIIVRPSVRGKSHPLTAYVSGTQLEGCGATVWDAIDDLMSDGDVGAICKQLHEAIERMRTP